MSLLDRNKDFEALCMAIGFTMVAWSHMESSLDAGIAILFRCAGGDRIQGRLPAALSRKLKFMRKCLNGIDGLREFRDRGLALMDRVEQMSKDRHVVTHGVPMSLESQSGMFEFRRLQSAGTIHKVQADGFDLNTFPDFALKLESLGSDMVHFARELALTFVPGYAQSGQ